MSWLQKYNNFIFAIFGTIALGAAIFALASGIIAFQKRDTQREGQELASSEEVQNRNEQNLSPQVVSFGAPILFMEDQLGLTIVPVMQTTPESGRSSGKLGGSSANYYSSSTNPSVSRSPIYWHRFGNYSNLLLKQRGSDKFEPLIEERGAITSFLILDKTTEPTIVYFVATNDTDQDGRLTLDDRQELRIRSLISGREYRFDEEVASFAYLAMPLQDEDSIVIFKNIDQNSDGRFDAAREPRQLVTINVVTGEIADYIDPALTERLQRLLVAE